ncbi:MAG: bis(5'-nucleosyl)-tetraphosphatase (symmetrical) YqeK [Lachnospiraceae bacterium]|nr:bis(5'-nucleosyl)-tetraphosphatase (symmetrical) YqeK [Lachnospiraceae bacterium]
MKQYNLEKISKKLRKELDEDRYRHTMGVMYTSAALAMRYGVDLNQAQTAGLLHDCAKCIPNDKKIRLCEKYGLPMTNIEKQAPFLLHAKLGAYLADKIYGVDDPEILGAIEWHTTGRPGMTLLEKIVYLADYIEPNRWKAQNLPEIRDMAFRDIDMAVYMTLRDTLAYLQSGSGEVDTMTQEAFTFYDTAMKNRKDKK